MNKTYRLLILALCLCTISLLHAGVPQGINYQSVARNAAGQILTNQPISIRFTVHDSSASGPAIYIENHTVITNQFGTFGVVIGGGSIILGNFNNILWGTNTKQLQVEMDFSGGSNYTNMGTSALTSVPYALYTRTSDGDFTGIKFDTSGTLIGQVVNGSNISSVRSVWLAGGNAGMTAVNNYIGTVDNVDVIFKRGAQEAVRLTAGGAFLATGDTTLGITPASGAGKRMEWIPARGAFRAGSVTGTAWDNANIGLNSIALGNDAKASGTNSMAIGNNTQAIGNNAIAVGNGIIAKAYNGMVIGTFNDTTGSGSSTGSNQSDVLFQIGNGTSSSARTNALTVNKSGQVLASQLLVTQSMTLTDTAVYPSSNFSIPVNYSFIRIFSSVTPGSARMTLGSGSRIGQLLVIEVPASVSGGNGIKAVDNAATNHTNLSGDIDMKAGDMMTFIWDGISWMELGYNSN